MKPSYYAASLRLLLLKYRKKNNPSILSVIFLKEEVYINLDCFFSPSTKQAPKEDSDINLYNAQIKLNCTEDDGSS